MPNALSIQSLTLSRGKRSLPHPMDGHRDISFDVKIKVQNLGARPLHVIRELRTMAYDGPASTLTLRLHEPAPVPAEKNAPTLHLPAPHTITVAPQEVATIVVTIPAILTTMRPGKDGVLMVERTELKDMRTIRCEVGSSETPVKNVPNESVHQLRSRMVGWGQVAIAEEGVKPDTREQGANGGGDQGSTGQKKK
ncbi:MAG: hypothetical protein IT229_10820 [Flavobacteriales bacterium]|nr:hypothetical protein [Flavobacteriales bacterium]